MPLKTCTPPAVAPLTLPDTVSTTGERLWTVTSGAMVFLLAWLPSELRTLRPPRHRRFVSVRCAKQHRLRERLAGQLHRHRQPALAEAGADADGGKARDVARHCEGRLLHVGPFRHLIDAR